MDQGFMAHRLLLYGYDPVLLHTRCSIVNTTGLAECTILKPRDYHDVLKIDAGSFSGVVICHTVPVEERRSIAELAAQHRKAVLQIERFMEPKEFVTAVSRLVSGDDLP